MNLKNINFDELKEITEPQIFDPPRKLLVWSYCNGEPENVREADVVAILPSLPYHANILCAGSIGITWATHCAENPENIENRKLNAEKVIAYHKFKRCLSKAKWCESEVYNIMRTPLCDMDEHEGWRHDDEFWQRWKHRWLEIAEKFKETK